MAQHRLRRSSFLVAVVLSGAMTLAAVPASALSSTDQELLGSRNVEALPAASESLLAWTENSHEHPHAFNAYARAIGGEPATKLNAEGTKGYTSGIDGT